MDSIKAKSLETLLVSNTVNGYKIIELLDHGKTAAVFRAEKNDEDYAIKVFDKELIESFGQEIQDARIDQELSLIGHSIPNLVRIVDGGKGNVAGQEILYLVMEYIKGENLKNFISKNTIDVEFTKEVLKVLNQVTEDLILENIVHRDIKPENIMIDEHQNITVMDLGVIKQVGTPSGTDVKEKQFIGTLRYAPPEFLLRVEEDTLDGWRAVNIYQIGATLHDLIMKKELFSERAPYTNLVIAIKEDMPSINNSDYSYLFQSLVRNMLSKQPQRRLELFNSINLNEILNEGNNKEGDNLDILERIKKSNIVHKEAQEDIKNIQRTVKEKETKRHEISQEILKTADDIFRKIHKSGLYSRYESSGSFQLLNDHDNGSSIKQNNLYTLQGTLEEGFIRPIHLWLRVANDESSDVCIELLLIIPTGFDLFYFKKLNNNIINYLNKISKRNAPRGKDYKFDFFRAFEGSLEIDEGFSERLESFLLRFIEKAIIVYRPAVTAELDSRKETLTSNKRGSVSIRVGVSEQTQFINKL